MNKREQVFGLSAHVAHVVDDSFLSGGTLQAVDRFRSPIDGIRIDLEGVRRLQDEVIKKFAPMDPEADVWLEPRFHALVRLTRRQARDQGLWRWLSLDVMKDYVRHRWVKKKDGRIKPYRYLGGGHFLRRNAASRLWWGAEMLRNGPSYLPVEAIRSSAVEQYVLDQRFGNMKASALAFARVALKTRFSNRLLTFDEIKELSKRANLLLSATALESLAPPTGEEMGEVDGEWLADEPNVEVVVKQKVEDIRGPDDGEVTEAEINAYERWYVEIAAELAQGTKGAAPASAT